MAKRAEAAPAERSRIVVPAALGARRAERVPKKLAATNGQSAGGAASRRGLVVAERR